MSVPKALLLMVFGGLVFYLFYDLFDFFKRSRKPLFIQEKMKILSLEHQLKYSSFYLASFIPLFKEIIYTLKNKLGIKVNFDFKEGTIYFFDNDKLLLTMRVTGECSAPGTLHLSNLERNDIKDALQSVLKEKPNLLKWSYIAQGNKQIDYFLFLNISP